MKDKAKVRFLRVRERQLDSVVSILANGVDALADHENAEEFSDFTNRLEACLREIKAIRSAISDKADELGGAS